MPLSNEHLGLGHKKRGGRKRGIHNKVTADLKEMILEALGRAGGAGYLLAQAERNPGAFMTLLGKIIPLQVAGADGGQSRRLIVELVYVEPGELPYSGMTCLPARQDSKQDSGALSSQEVSTALPSSQV